MDKQTKLNSITIDREEYICGDNFRIQLNKFIGDVECITIKGILLNNKRNLLDSGESKYTHRGNEMFPPKSTFINENNYSLTIPAFINKNNYLLTIPAYVAKEISVISITDIYSKYGHSECNIEHILILQDLTGYYKEGEGVMLCGHPYYYRYQYSNRINIGFKVYNIYR